MVCLFFVFNSQHLKESSTLRAELSQRSHTLKQAVAMNKDILQRKSKELTQAELERGSAEHQMQAQQDTILSLQQEIAEVSCLLLVVYCGCLLIVLGCSLLVHCWFVVVSLFLL